MHRISTVAAILLAASAAGCTSPAEYAGTLSTQDPKWNSPECQEMRADAANYEAEEKKTISMATGLLLGPYGLGIALAGKDHREKQRQRFVRDMHLKCSSQPLPRNMQYEPPKSG